MMEHTAYAITDGSGWYWWTFQPTAEQAIEKFAGHQGFERGQAKWAKAQASGHRCEEIGLKVAATCSAPSANPNTATDCKYLQVPEQVEMDF